MLLYSAYLLALGIWWAAKKLTVSPNWCSVARSTNSSKQLIRWSDAEAKIYARNISSSFIGSVPVRHGMIRIGANRIQSCTILVPDLVANKKQEKRAPRGRPNFHRRKKAYML
jgi:hypothetical protein